MSGLSLIVMFCHLLSLSVFSQFLLLQGRTSQFAEFFRLFSLFHTPFLLQFDLIFSCYRFFLLRFRQLVFRPEDQFGRILCRFLE